MNTVPTNEAAQPSAPPQAEEAADREAVEQKYKWNLGDIYESREAFDADMALVRTQMSDLSASAGTLKDAASVKKVLTDYYAAGQRISKLANYAYMTFDEDVRKTEGAAMKKMIEQLGSELGQAAAYIDPELLEMPKERLAALVVDPNLKDFRMRLSDLLRQKDHVLSEKEESLLARGSITRSAGYNVFSVFLDGEVQFPEVQLADGQKVEVSQNAYEKYRKNPDRGDREKVFNAFFSTLGKYKNTFAETLASQINANIYYAESKKYGSVLESALFTDDIPVPVYEKIISEVSGNLPVLHRYLALKKKILGVDQLNYYDLYAPVAKGIPDKYSYEQGNELILSALKPMGDRYLDVVAKAIKPGNGWIDVYPNKGKSTGAYCSDGGYGIHPFILMNFVDDYRSVSTAIHELGHAMHTYFSYASQPYPQADYTIFAAEVASTFNESLLLEDRLSKETDKDKKIALLGESLETMRTTIFRQAFFAEFQYKVYQAAEAKTPITSEFLNSTYLGLLKKYYGQDAGVVNIDDLYGIEWAYVPHFYYNFYVYKYVSGYLAGLALSEQVLEGDAGVRDAYVDKFLSSGGSKYPLEELKDVGVDFAADGVYQKAFSVFEKRIDELEKLVQE